jgi:hypothetical protein
MSIEDRNLLIIITVLAFSLSNTAEYCKGSPASEQNIIKRQSPFNPICYVSNFQPENPELETNSSLSQTPNFYRSQFTGTASASPSPEPDFNS